MSDVIVDGGLVSPLFTLVPVVFIGVGVLMTLLGLRGRRTAKEFRARAARATGLVTEVHSRYEVDRTAGVDTGNAVRHCPVVRFTLPDGREVETETPGAHPSPAKQGEQVPVLYDPDLPTNAVLDSGWSDGSIGSGCVTAFGIGFAILGALFLSAVLAFRAIA